MKKDFAVAKFGGSSVRDASSMLNCINSLKKNRDIKVVILSATYNTTNLIEEIYHLSIAGELYKALELLNSSIERHINLARDLHIKIDSDVIFKNIISHTKENIEKLYESQKDVHENNVNVNRNKQLLDELYSYGELISSLIFSKLIEKEINIETTWLDARRFIKTDSTYQHATPCEIEIKKLCKEYLLPILSENHVVVTQGFIGSDSAGKTTTLGREGSDYSATLIANACELNEVFIFTDVDGIYSVDPNIIQNSKKYTELSYQAATDLALHGAKVLFPRTLKPAIKNNILVEVLKTGDRRGTGTLISSKFTSEPYGIAIFDRNLHHLLDFDVKDDFIVISLVGIGLDLAKKRFSSLSSSFKKDPIADNSCLISIEKKNYLSIMNEFYRVFFC